MGYRWAGKIQVTCTDVLQECQLCCCGLWYNTGCEYSGVVMPRLGHTDMSDRRRWIRPNNGWRSSNDRRMRTLSLLLLVTNSIWLQDAEAYAKEAGLLFFETSAKTSENVRELFTSIAKKLPLDQAGPRNPRAGGRGGVELRPEASGTQAGPGCTC